ncbi:putative peptidase [Streptococcus pneumoniae]|nr:putative peptidase [Streptococcus pneumoniae]
MKKIGTYLVYVLAFVFIMLAFACGTIAFAELGYSAVLAFTFGYALRSSKHVFNLYSS